MPIEIRELIISANVPKKGKHPSKGPVKSRKAQNDQDTVSAAVDTVMRIMKKKKER